jgi:hypothetical protein
VLTTCQPSTVWCSRERLPAAAAQSAKVQSCSATDYYYYYYYYYYYLYTEKQITVGNFRQVPKLERFCFGIWGASKVWLSIVPEYVVAWRLIFVNIIISRTWCSSINFVMKTFSVNFLWATNMQHPHATFEYNRQNGLWKGAKHTDATALSHNETHCVTWTARKGTQMDGEFLRTRNYKINTEVLI